MRKFGKITRAKWGVHIDRPFLFGLYLAFGGSCWGVSTHEVLNISPECEYSDDVTKESEMERVIAKTVELLKSAKVHTIDELIGKPVEVTFNGTTISSYRILEEVL